MISHTQLIDALKQAGLKKGSTVFSHSNLAFFGAFENCQNLNSLAEIFFNSIIDIIGNEGNLVCPLFTYSFGSDKFEKVFDINENVPGMCPIGNFLLERGEGIRSPDPMLSVLCYGKDQNWLAQISDNICFGSNSIWRKLYDFDAIICNFNFDSGSTFIHWVERELKVSYRYDFELSGTIKTSNARNKKTVIYSGRDLTDPNSTACFSRYHECCVKANMSTLVNLGRGQIVSQNCRDAHKFIGELLRIDSRILTLGR